MKQLDSFVKSRFATYSKIACPKCGKSPCTCSDAPSQIGGKLDSYSWDDLSDDEKSKRLDEAKRILGSNEVKDLKFTKLMEWICRNRYNAHLDKKWKEVKKFDEAQAVLTKGFSVTQPSEGTDLSKVKAKLISLVDFSSIADEAVAKEVKENILNADAPELLKMVQEEIEDVSKIEPTESYLNGLKEVESELKAFCGEQKTYSKVEKPDWIKLYMTLDEAGRNPNDSKESIDRAMEFLSNSMSKEMKDEISDAEFKMTVGDVYTGSEFAIIYVDKKKNLKSSPINSPNPSFAYKFKSDVIDPILSYSKTKTYSAMSDYDVDLAKETKGILGKVTGSVGNIPEPKEGESGAQFFKRCLKWAKNADENPEPELYNDLVKLGKKYNMEVE